MASNRIEAASTLAAATAKRWPDDHPQGVPSAVSWKRKRTSCATPAFMGPDQTKDYRTHHEIISPKFSDRFCDKHKIREDCDTRRYSGGAGGLSFVGSIAKNGAFRDNSGTVRGYITNGSYRRTR